MTACLACIAHMHTHVHSLLAKSAEPTGPVQLCKSLGLLQPAQAPTAGNPGNACAHLDILEDVQHVEDIMAPAWRSQISPRGSVSH